MTGIAKFVSLALVTLCVFGADASSSSSPFMDNSCRINHKVVAQAETRLLQVVTNVQQGSKHSEELVGKGNEHQKEGLGLVPAPQAAVCNPDQDNLGPGNCAAGSMCARYIWAFLPPDDPVWTPCGECPHNAQWRVWCVPPGPLSVVAHVAANGNGWCSCISQDYYQVMNEE